jgi:hypothetical protein
MTISRRQTLIGGAATVAAAALPATAEARQAPDLWHGVRVIKRVVRPANTLTAADLDEMAKAEVVTDRPYELEDIPEIV